MTQNSSTVSVVHCLLVVFLAAAAVEVPVVGAAPSAVKDDRETLLFAAGKDKHNQARKAFVEAASAAELGYRLGCRPTNPRCDSRQSPSGDRTGAQIRLRDQINAVSGDALRGLELRLLEGMHGEVLGVSLLPPALKLSLKNGKTKTLDCQSNSDSFKTLQRRTDRQVGHQCDLFMVGEDGTSRLLNIGVFRATATVNKSLAEGAVMSASFERNSSKEADVFFTKQVESMSIVIPLLYPADREYSLMCASTGDTNSDDKLALCESMGTVDADAEFAEPQVLFEGQHPTWTFARSEQLHSVVLTRLSTPSRKKKVQVTRIQSQYPFSVTNPLEVPDGQPQSNSEAIFLYEFLCSSLGKLKGGRCKGSLSSVVLRIRSTSRDHTLGAILLAPSIDVTNNEKGRPKSIGTDVSGDVRLLAAHHAAVQARGLPSHLMEIDANLERKIARYLTAEELRLRPPAELPNMLLALTYMSTVDPNAYYPLLSSTVLRLVDEQHRNGGMFCSAGCMGTRGRSINCHLIFTWTFFRIYGVLNHYTTRMYASQEVMGPPPTPGETEDLRAGATLFLNLTIAINQALMAIPKHMIYQQSSCVLVTHIRAMQKAYCKTLLSVDTALKAVQKEVDRCGLRNMVPPDVDEKVVATELQFLESVFGAVPSEGLDKNKKTRAKVNFVERRRTLLTRSFQLLPWSSTKLLTISSRTQALREQAKPYLAFLTERTFSKVQLDGREFLGLATPSPADSAYSDVMSTEIAKAMEALLLPGVFDSYGTSVAKLSDFLLYMVANPLVISRVALPPKNRNSGNFFVERQQPSNFKVTNGLMVFSERPGALRHRYRTHLGSLVDIGYYNGIIVELRLEDGGREEFNLLDVCGAPTLHPENGGRTIVAAMEGELMMEGDSIAVARYRFVMDSTRTPILQEVSITPEKRTTIDEINVAVQAETPHHGATYRRVCGSSSGRTQCYDNLEVEEGNMLDKTNPEWWSVHETDHNALYRRGIHTFVDQDHFHHVSVSRKDAQGTTRDSVTYSRTHYRCVKATHNKPCKIEEQKLATVDGRYHHWNDYQEAFSKIGEKTDEGLIDYTTSLDIGAELNALASFFFFAVSGSYNLHIENVDEIKNTIDRHLHIYFDFDKGSTSPPTGMLQHHPYMLLATTSMFSATLDSSYQAYLLPGLRILRKNYIEGNSTVRCTRGESNNPLECILSAVLAITRLLLDVPPVPPPNDGIAKDWYLSSDRRLVLFRIVQELFAGFRTSLGSAAYLAQASSVLVEDNRRLNLFSLSTGESFNSMKKCSLALRAMAGAQEVYHRFGVLIPDRERAVLDFVRQHCLNQLDRASVSYQEAAAGTKTFVGDSVTPSAADHTAGLLGLLAHDVELLYLETSELQRSRLAARSKPQFIWPATQSTIGMPKTTLGVFSEYKSIIEKYSRSALTTLGHRKNSEWLGIPGVAERSPRAKEAIQKAFNALTDGKAANVDILIATQTFFFARSLNYFIKTDTSVLREIIMDVLLQPPKRLSDSTLLRANLLMWTATMDRTYRSRVVSLVKKMFSRTPSVESSSDLKSFEMLWSVAWLLYMEDPFLVFTSEEKNMREALLQWIKAFLSSGAGDWRDLKRCGGWLRAYSVIAPLMKKDEELIPERNEVRGTIETVTDTCLAYFTKCFDKTTGQFSLCGDSLYIIDSAISDGLLGLYAPAVEAMYRTARTPTVMIQWTGVGHTSLALNDEMVSCAAAPPAKASKVSRKPPVLLFGGVRDARDLLTVEDISFIGGALQFFSFLVLLIFLVVLYRNRGRPSLGKWRRRDPVQ